MISSISKQLEIYLDEYASIEPLLFQEILLHCGNGSVSTKERRNILPKDLMEIL